MELWNEEGEGKREAGVREGKGKERGGDVTAGKEERD